MSTVLAKLPIIFHHKTAEYDEPSQDNLVFNRENGQVFESLTDRLERSAYLIYGNVRSGAPIVLWFGHEQSLLRTKLIKLLEGQDVILILFSIEEYLWQWLQLNPSLTIVCIVLQPMTNSQALISCTHDYVNIRSILVHCGPAEVTILERFTRTYPKVDEELGDHQREDENNEFEAQRNYDRALKLCAIVRSLNSQLE